MIVINENYCPKNHFCPAQRVCPTGAIVQDNAYSAPRIVEEKCIECRKCTLACGVFQWEESPAPAQA